VKIGDGTASARRIVLPHAGQTGGFQIRTEDSELGHYPPLSIALIVQVSTVTRKELDIADLIMRPRRVGGYFAQSREELTERAFPLPRKLRGCSWTSRKDSPLGAVIALAQDSFDRDKTR
jgi:hypothetical protein